jgi:hypothetical protein
MLNQRIALRGPEGILWNRRASPLARGKRYHVDAQKTGNRLVLVVNGQPVFDVRDERMVYEEGNAYAGFYNYNADTRYSNIQLFLSDPALAADLLDVAQDYLERGKHAFAQDLFQQVIYSSDDPERTGRAKRGLNRASHHIRLAAEFPAIRARLLKAWPRAEIALGVNGISVGVDGLGISDLGPLKGLTLGELSCRYNQITSLEPLQGTELRRLDCIGNQITSLEPLKGAPLVSLNCGRNRIQSLEPLRGMNLGNLNCEHNCIESLEPLRGMKLNELRFSRNQVKNLDPLKGMELQVLGFSENQVSSLEPLRGMALTEIICASNEVDSLEPLRGMGLVGLRCENNRIRSLDPLQGMKLQMLDCTDNPLTSIGGAVPYSGSEWDIDIERLSPTDQALFRERCPKSTYDSSWRKSRIRTLARQGDVAGLKAYASRLREHRYLVVPLSVTWEQARKICEDLGGHLADIASREENEIVRSQVPLYTPALIGLALHDRKPAWITGRPMSFDNLEESHGASGFGCISAEEKWSIASIDSKLKSFCIEWDE